MPTTAARHDASPAPDRLLRPGDTCWRIARADRAGLVVDAQDYFRAVKEAMLAARHSIMLIGWDFDLRIQFEPDGATLEGPNALGPFLRWIGKTRPELKIYVLKWDLGMVQALGRGSTPLMILDWTTSDNIRFHLDGAHPPGAAHHQKIVAIDDVSPSASPESVGVAVSSLAFSCVVGGTPALLESGAAPAVDGGGAASTPVANPCRT